MHFGLSENEIPVVLWFEREDNFNSVPVFELGRNDSIYFIEKITQLKDFNENVTKLFGWKFDF